MRKPRCEGSKSAISTGLKYCVKFYRGSKERAYTFLKISFPIF